MAMPRWLMGQEIRASVAWPWAVGHNESLALQHTLEACAGRALVVRWSCAGRALGVRGSSLGCHRSRARAERTERAQPRAPLSRDNRTTFHAKREVR